MKIIAMLTLVVNGFILLGVGINIFNALRKHDEVNGTDLFVEVITMLNVLNCLIILWGASCIG